MSEAVTRILQSVSEEENAEEMLESESSVLKMFRLMHVREVQALFKPLDEKVRLLTSVTEALNTDLEQARERIEILEAENEALREQQPSNLNKRVLEISERVEGVLNVPSGS